MLEKQRLRATNMSSHIGKKPGHWEGESRLLFLAPMAGVSDLPFRLLAKDCGADVTITEFTNSTALTREAAMSWRKMESHEREVPFIINKKIDQIASNKQLYNYDAFYYAIVGENK